MSIATELIEAVERKTNTERETSVERDVVAERDIAVEIGAGESGPIPFDQLPAMQVVVTPQSRLVCLVDRESIAAEKFRFLGVRLRQLRQNRPLK
ncbi:MAG: hypothetical protein WBX03_07135, partial [Terriglobales bacterium]